jgi:hypothetical protein
LTDTGNGCFKGINLRHDRLIPAEQVESIEIMKGAAELQHTVQVLQPGY